MPQPCYSATWKDAYRRRFDPTLALRYTDVFFKDNAELKQKGTEVLIRYHESKSKNWGDVEDRCEIDPILDTLDDIGFLVQGHQISDWVAYQYFSYWVQLYYEAARDYIELRQKEDPTIWEHVPYLYDDMMEISAFKCKKEVAQLRFDPADLITALKDENSMFKQD